MHIKIRYLLFFLAFLISLRGIGQEKIQLSITSTNNQRTIDSLNYKKTHLNFPEAHNEINILNKKIQQLGFFQSKIDSIHRKQNLVEAFFTLNQKTDTIYIYSKDTGFKKDLTGQLKNDTTLVCIPSNLENTLNNITKQYIEKGEPFTSVYLSNFKSKNNITYTTLKIERSNKRRLDSIAILGYTKFPKSFIKNYLKLSKEKVFNQKNIKTKTNRLNNINFITVKKTPEILFTEEKTTLFLYLEKRNANYFDGFLGFSTNEETNTLEINGQIDLELKNNLNYGERLKIYWKNNGQEQSNFKGNLTLPYLFNTPLSINTQLNLTKQDSTFSNTGFNIGLYYQIQPNYAIGASRTSTSSNKLDNNITGVEEFSSHFYNINFNYNNNITNQILNSYLLIDITGGIGKRTAENINNNQQLITVNIEKQWKINNSNYLFTKNTFNKLFSNEYLENEKFRFGGINSIRGFSENTLISTTTNVTNLEYRKILSKKLYLNSITDIAFFEEETSKIKPLYSLGLGLGILGEKSLLKLNYAIGFNNSNNQSLRDSKLHISLTTYF